jgi:hypothetical protein
VADACHVVAGTGYCGGWAVGSLATGSKRASEASIGGGQAASVGDGERRKEGVRHQVSPDAPVLGDVCGEHVPGRGGRGHRAAAAGLAQPVDERDRLGGGCRIGEDPWVGDDAQECGQAVVGEGEFILTCHQAGKPG